MLGPVQDLDPLLGGGNPVGDLPGPVGRVVVDDEDPRVLGQLREDGGDEGLDVLGLVIGGQDQPCRAPRLGGRHGARAWPARP